MSEAAGRVVDVRGRLAMAWLPVGVSSSLALASAAASLSSVLFGWSWYLPVLCCLLAVTVATAAGRFISSGPWASFLLGLAALGATLLLFFFSGTTFLGIIPTARSWGLFWELMAQAVDTLQHEVVPANARPGITFLSASILGLLALLADWLAVRARAPMAVALPLLAVLLVPALLSYTSVGLWPFAGSAFFFAMTLAGTRRAQRTADRLAEASGPGPAFRIAARGPGRAVILGAAAVVVALVIPTAIPGFTEGLFPQGSRLGSLGRSNGLNPLLTLNSNLRQGGNGTAISYFTTAKSAPYLRLTTIDSFSGDRWGPENRDKSLQDDILQLQSPTAAAFFGPRSEMALTEVTTRDFSSPYLPVPEDTVSVVGAKGNWGFDPDTLSIKNRADGTSAGEVYVAHSVVPNWTAESLRALYPEGPSVPVRFQELPGNVPAIIRDTAQKVAGSASTEFDKALALQKYLRSADFSYSLTAPADHGYDGTGMNVLAQFLTAKSGYCIHYATAMAVMARVLGLPSRVAVGYAPGHPTGAVRDGNPARPSLREYTVSAEDAHAWPEIYLVGAGWVPFEPTPSRGVVPDYAFDPSSAGSALDTPDELRPRATSSATAPTASASPTASPSAQAAPVRPSAWGEDIDWPEIGFWAGAGLVLILLAVSPRILRTVQRRRRLTAAQPPGAVRIGAMEELLATAADYGAAARAPDTPRAFGSRLAEPFSTGGRTAVAELVRDYELTRYGASDDTADDDGEQARHSAEQLAVVDRELRGQARPGARFAARWLPPSLFRSRRR
ncbi:transglutaminaseTgpA domain-containing protein [Arthrobacter sp. NPDC090010]|uniref:transglutaminase family protein n=1 Tax=Arthrobacter sp. NPDC090010 TaxID=3363942 RepID=UPI00381EF8F9